MSAELSISVSGLGRTVEDKVDKLAQLYHKEMPESDIYFLGEVFGAKGSKADYIANFLYDTYVNTVHRDQTKLTVTPCGCTRLRAPNRVEKTLNMRIFLRFFVLLGTRIRAQLHRAMKRFGYINEKLLILLVNGKHFRCGERREARCMVLCHRMGLLAEEEVVCRFGLKYTSHGTIFQ
jgi:hypothetical protein